MTEITYVPMVCQPREEAGATIAPTFKGSLKMRIPTFQERWDYFAQIGMKMNAGGIDQTNLQDDQMGTAVKLALLAEKHVVAVDLTKIADGRVYKSYADLAYDQECDAILFELGMAMLRGFGPTPKQ